MDMYELSMFRCTSYHTGVLGFCVAGVWEKGQQTLDSTLPMPPDMLTEQKKWRKCSILSCILCNGIVENSHQTSSG